LFSLTEKRFSIIFCQVYSRFGFYIGHWVMSMYTACSLVVQRRCSLERGIFFAELEQSLTGLIAFSKSMSSYSSWFFSLSYFSVPVSHNYEYVNGWEVQSITTIFIISYEVEYIADYLLQFATTCFGLIGHHQVVNIL
jgi:hypothetical protein